MPQLQRHTLSRSVPDDQLNWSQIGETLTLLALAVAQIDTSMKEGNDSVDTLTHSFTSIASKSRLLLDHFAKVDPDAPQDIKDAAEIIHQEVGKAVVAFQFYDRLSQRMEHVGESLEKMGHLIDIALKKVTAEKNLQTILDELFAQSFYMQDVLYGTDHAKSKWIQTT